MKKQRLYLLTSLMCAMLMHSVKSMAYSLEVESWGPGGNFYTGTLPDSTRFGFYRTWWQSWSGMYVNNIESNASSIEIPDTIFWSYYSTYPVTDFGDNSGFVSINAPNLTKFVLPHTIRAINAEIPSSVRELHITSENPPYLASSNLISDSTYVYVPQELAARYYAVQKYGINKWSDDIHIVYNSSFDFDITVDTPGTLLDVLLQQAGAPTNVAELTVKGNINDRDLNRLYQLTSLTRLDLSQTSITQIKGCSGLEYLTEVILPPTTTIVGEDAFRGCKNLKTINLQNVTIIESGAFRDCSALQEIDCSSVEEIRGGASFYHCHSLKKISLPQLKTIGNSTFYGCDSLRDAYLPLITEIGTYAFYDCDSLREAYLPLATEIGSYAFSDCNSLREAYLPLTTEIGSGAFRYCDSLKSVFMPMVTSIGYASFYNSKLYTLDLPSVKEIGEQAFYSYDQSSSTIQSINIPNIVSIGRDVFYGQSHLKTISLPNTLQSLGSRAFFGCDSLTDVYCHVSLPLSTSAFSSTTMTKATLHVPTFSVDLYAEDNNWNAFDQIMPIDEEVDMLHIKDKSITINSIEGIAEKASVEMSIGDYNNTNLTVAAETPWIIGNFSYETFAHFLYRSYTISLYSRDYYQSSLISNSDISADSISIDVNVAADQWNFISFPFDVKVSNIKVPAKRPWVIRRYSGENRAAQKGDTWQNMTDSMTLKAGEGYILHCTDNITFQSGLTLRVQAIDNENKNRIFAYQDVEVPLNIYNSELENNRSWNLVGNPYPCYYDTPYIEHDGIITVWNGYGYTPYSLKDDNYQLQPTEAFFVQCPEGSSSMTFKAAGRTHENRDFTTFINNSNAKVRKAQAASASSSRHIYNITLSGNDYTDRARVVINEAAKLDYEISCDASKFMSSDASVPQLYAVENGQRLAIDERPLGNGTVQLGAYLGTGGAYTIALSGQPDGNEILLLIDNETGIATDLTKSDYTFMGTKGSDDQRFTLNIVTEATGIANVGGDRQTSGAAIYNLNGQRLSAPLRGVNIINGKKVLVR